MKHMEPNVFLSFLLNYVISATRGLSIKTMATKDFVYCRHLAEWDHRILLLSLSNSYH